MDVCDVTVGLTHGHRPVPRTAHHHALEDRLTAECRHFCVLWSCTARWSRCFISDGRANKSARPEVGTASGASTACPPSVVTTKPLAAARAAAGTLEPALEALDATARIDELLLARVERMA